MVMEGVRTVVVHHLLNGPPAMRWEDTEYIIPEDAQMILTKEKQLKIWRGKDSNQNLLFCLSDVTSFRDSSITIVPPPEKKDWVEGGSDVNPSGFPRVIGGWLCSNLDDVVSAKELIRTGRRGPY